MASLSVIGANDAGFGPMSSSGRLRRQAPPPKKSVLDSGSVLLLSWAASNEHGPRGWLAGSFISRTADARSSLVVSDCLVFCGRK